LRWLAIQHGDVADNLHQLCAGLLGHNFNRGTACFTIFSRDFDFNQRVVVKRDIEFSE